MMIADCRGLGSRPPLGSCELRVTPSALSGKFPMLIVRVVCYCWAWQDPTFD